MHHAKKYSYLVFGSNSQQISTWSWNQVSSEHAEPNQNMNKNHVNYGMVRFDSKYNPWSLEWNVAVDWEGFNAYEVAWYNSKLLRVKPMTDPN
ncbi:hypothetical protein OUZ56_027398 [Daphnia magna]|uniref:Uncharacterized protein n=1 Tax=Daphnia magna TaxID=35525 RepID=A0ABQ9ZQ12_9CRUS|nr:hypothetical protein OUZ56_027398 [Daphnia magna]